MKIVILFILAASFNVCAETSLVINGLSYHVPRHDGKKHFNEKNYGLEINEFYGDFFFVAGAMKNSFSKISTYIGAGYDFSKYSGIKLGMATGYRNTVIPMLVPYFRVPMYKSELLLGMPFSPNKPQLVTLQLRIPLPL